MYREEVGPDAARKFLGHTQWLVNYWLLQNGFSIGIGDTIADAATMEKINETISKAKNEVKDLIRAAQDKQLEAEPGRTMMESFENRVNQVDYYLSVECFLPHGLIFEKSYDFVGNFLNALVSCSGAEQGS